MPYGASLRMGTAGLPERHGFLAVVAAWKVQNRCGCADRGYQPMRTRWVFKTPAGDNQLAVGTLQLKTSFTAPSAQVFPGRRPACAARARGGALEVRLMDLDPFEPVGITTQTHASSTSCCIACSVTARTTIPKLPRWPATSADCARARAGCCCSLADGRSSQPDHWRPTPHR
jgi:hypothetical protein